MTTGHADRTHARYSASAAHRWIACPGSVPFLESVPQRPSGPWAQDGTEAHELVEYALKAGERDAMTAYVASGIKWTHREDTEEARLDSVQMMLDYVCDLLDSYDDAIVYVEHQFLMPSYDPATGGWHKDAGGTNDVILISPSLHMIHVIDFKHGAGEAVDVVENMQLMMYGVGALTLPECEELDPAIVLTIVQPRAYHTQGPIREWITTTERLVRFVTEVDTAIARCNAPNAPLVPGAKQCRWCEPTQCPAVERKAMQAIGTNFATVRDVTIAPTLPTTVDMPVDRLGEILAVQDTVTAFFNAAYDRAYELARAGYSIPGFKLVEAQSKRKFTGDDVATADALMRLSGAGIDDVMPRTLIGIMAAEKLVVDNYKLHAPKGGIRKAATDGKAAMALLTTKDTSGNLVLVPASDRRIGISLGAQFGQVQALPIPAIST